MCTVLFFRCKKNKIEKLLESEKGTKDPDQKVTLPSSNSDGKNAQKYDLEKAQ